MAAASSRPSVAPPAPLSRRQWQTLQALRTLWKGAACPPTREELGMALGVRAQTADFHLRALARKGFVELGRNARAIRLLPPAEALLAPRRRPHGAAASTAPAVPASLAPPTIPIIGRVAAGLPILAVENQEGAVPAPPGLHADYALRVQGDSMIEAGIHDGDVVFVVQDPQPAAGQIVVALVGEGESLEATVKAYHPQRGRVVLAAANPAYADLIITADTPCTVAGSVVGLWRDRRRSFTWQPHPRRHHGRRHA